MDFKNYITFLLVCVHALCPSQQVISHVMTFPGLNKILAEDSRTKCSAYRKSQTCDHSILSQAIYYRVIVLPEECILPNCVDPDKM